MSMHHIYILHLNFVMVFYFVFLFLVRWINVTTGLEIYAGITACNKTIFLDSKLYAGFLNFNNMTTKFTYHGTMTCNILLHTQKEHFIGIKFLPKYVNTTSTKHRRRFTITSQDVNIPASESFPDYEVISRTFLHIKYEILNLSNSINDISQVEYFDILFYTFHFMNTNTGSCVGHNTVCEDSLRCLPQSLLCSQIYDFCANNFQNCTSSITIVTPETKIMNVSEGVSYNGVYIFTSCLVFLLAVMVYLCFCRTIVSYCKHSCKCTRNRHGMHASIVDQSGDQPEAEVQETENNDVMITNLNESTNVSSTFEVQNDDSNAMNDVQFGLPPSYSYLEEHETFQEPKEGTYVTRSMQVSDSRSSLPPSYSTVLHHEDEYHVHVY